MQMEDFNKSKDELISELERLREENNSLKIDVENVKLECLLNGNILRKSHSLLNETGKMAKVGGWEFDLATMTLQWSQEVYRIHEVELDFEITIEKATNFYEPNSRPIITAAIENTIKTGEAFNIELELITAKNNRIHVNAIGKPNYLNEKVVGISGTFQDITERKLNELSLRKSEEKYKCFL